MAKALQQLGLDRSQVDVEVVSEGRSGILGVGAQQAHVIVTPRPGVVARGSRVADEEEDDYDDEEYEDDDEEYDDEDEEYDEEEDEYDDEDEEDDEELAPAPHARTPRAGVATPPRGQGMPARSPRGPRPIPEPIADPNDPVAVAIETVEHILELLDIDATVTSRPAETVGDGTVNAVLDIAGDDLSLLIGRRGETLASLQYLVNLILNRRVKGHASVGIDIDGYRRRREETLQSLARRMADRVISSGQSITLEPMPPNERRIVHLTLADHPDVLTVSIGEGESRKVAITPRR
ncbi:MAG: RNA-binding cell elongation regulator Jag/EloR [Dehalococcoidia bacterium]